MKKIYAFLFTLLLASGAAAQNPTAYFMEGSTLRSQFNPAFAPLRGYVNIPGLGGLDINVSGNLSIDKILYPRNGKLVTLLDSSVSTADALSGLKADNLLGLDTRVNLIGFGAFTRNHKNFWSFDLNARVTTDATLPYSLFDFLKRGNSGDISDIGITADSYLEAGFNYSFPLLDDKLYIGVRAKFLMGVARARMYFTQFNVSHNEERWLINAAGGLDITAAGLDVKTELNDHGEEVYKMDDISLKPTSPAGYGFAVDFGATYDILPNLQASLAVNDLGFIGWSKNKTRVNLIGFGAFTRNHKNFWSFDLNARVTTDATLPYSLFDFLKRGNSGDISDIGITADSYLEAGFNYSFPLLDDKLYIGVRAKFLMGVARARMYFTQFNVSHNEERWLINAAGGLDITAAGLDVKTELNDHGEEVYKMDDISLKPTSPAGYGFAVDFGATYDILPNLQASLAVNDLGFIGWSKNKNVTGYSAKELSFTGVTVTEDGTESPDFDIDVLEFHKGAAKSVSRMLRASINAGLEYEVWRHKIGIGLLYTARVWEYKTLHNITGSVNFHPIRWFTVTGSYSVIDNRGGAVGLALNLNPSWINFYLATDIVTAKHTPQFIPIKQSVMNVTLGIGVPIGRRSHRIAAYVYDKDRR